MKLFLIRHKKAPDTFQKADTKDEAEENWYNGIVKPENFPKVEVIEIRDLEHLMEFLPKEFKIDDDASF